MAASEVKLLGAWPSPFVHRVMMALKIKSINYEHIEINPFDKTELLLRSNPVHKKIPVLIHGEKTICESLIIVQYIDENWPNNGPSILHRDPYERATARFWAAYIDNELLPQLEKHREAKGDEAKGAVMEKVTGGFLLLEKAYLDCGKGKDFFGGESVGYLDIALACLLGWFEVTKIQTGLNLLDETKTPGLAKWAKKMYSDASCVKDLMMDPQALIQVRQKFMAKTGDE